MAHYASSDQIDVTLRDIEVRKCHYEGALNHGFPNTEDPGAWKEDRFEREAPLSLHYGLETATLDYGVHKETDGTVRKPAFTTETGWIGLGARQNRTVHTNDEYYNKDARDTDLSKVDISPLFTGSTVIVVKDEKEVPPPTTPPTTPPDTPPYRVPHTGVEMSYGLWFALAGASGAGMTTALMKMKSKKKEK